jgi:hypothetical protein
MAWLYALALALALPLALAFVLATSQLSKGRRGWVCGTVERHGWRERAYMDVLAACPAKPPPPAQTSDIRSPRPSALTYGANCRRVHTP